MLLNDGASLVVTNYLDTVYFVLCYVISVYKLVICFDRQCPTKYKQTWESWKKLGYRVGQRAAGWRIWFEGMEGIVFDFLKAALQPFLKQNHKTFHLS